MRCISKCPSTRVKRKKRHFITSTAAAPTIKWWRPRWRSQSNQLVCMQSVWLRTEKLPKRTLNREPHSMRPSLFRLMCMHNMFYNICFCQNNRGKGIPNSPKREKKKQTNTKQSDTFDMSAKDGTGSHGNRKNMSKNAQAVILHDGIQSIVLNYVLMGTRCTRHWPKCSIEFHVWYSRDSIDSSRRNRIFERWQKDQVIQLFEMFQRGPNRMAGHFFNCLHGGMECERLMRGNGEIRFGMAITWSNLSTLFIDWVNLMNAVRRRIDMATPVR